MLQINELAAVGINAVEAFDHPNDTVDKLEKQRCNNICYPNTVDNASTSRLSQKSSASAEESFVTGISSNYDNILESFPSLQVDISTKSLATEEEVTRIKARVRIGRLRAIANFQRGFQRAKFINWRTSDTFEEDGDAESIEKARFGEDEFDFQDDSFEIISKYSNPRQRYAPELVPATTAIVDGETKMIITKEDVQYRKTINSLRIAKLKELYFEGVKQSQEGQEAFRAIKGGFNHPSKAFDETDAVFTSIGINTNPDPTLSELTQCKTPARIGDRFPKAEEPNADDPFTSLYGGSLKKQKEEMAQIGEYLEDTAFRGPSQHITTRFKIHDMLQNWLRTTYKAVRQEGRRWTARDVVRDVLNETHALFNREFELDQDAPLEKEVVPKERNAGPCVVDVNHFAISFLTAWLERCEKNEW